MKNSNFVLSSTNLGLSRLIHNLDKISFALLSKQLAQLNLSNVQALVIIYLSNNDREVFQRDLEKEFGVTNPTMTVSLKSMQKKGLIDKVKSEKDGRYYRLLLTESGKQLYPKCMAVYTEVEAMCDSVLTSEERDTFVKLTNKLLAGLQNYQDHQ